MNISKVIFNDGINFEILSEVKSRLFPVVEKEIIVTDKVVTKLVVGSRSISTKKLLEIVQR